MTSSKPIIPRLLDAGADIGPLVALVLSLPIIFLALEPFRFGFWQGAEPIIVAFHAGSALSTCALLLVFRRDRDLFLDTLLHPFVLFPGALAVWSAIVATQARFPLLAIVGPPQSGEGALWFANLAMLVACGLLVARRERQWRIVAVSAIAVGLIVALIQVIDLATEQPLLFWVPDYIAFFALALPFTSLPHTATNWRWLRWVAIIVAIFVLVMSENRAAQGFFVVGAALVFAVSRIDAESGLGRVVRSRVTGICIATGFALIPFLLIRSELAVDWVKSLWARHLASVVMDEAWRSGPWSSLLGHGWGHTQEALIVHVNAAKQNIFSIRWDLLVGDWFHSHNWIIESFYSAGVPGLVLAFAVFAALPAFCHRRTIVVAAVYASSLAVVTMVWFQLSSTIPFMALAMAAVAGGSATPVVLRRVRAPAAIVAPTVLVILMLAQSAAAAALLSFGLKVSATLAVYETPPSANADLHFPRDFRGAEFAFAKAVRERIVVLKEAKLKAGDPETESQRSVMRAIFEDLEARIDDRDSPFLVLAGIAAISDIMYDPALAWLKPDYVARTGLWGRWIATFLRQAPMRSDVAIAYFGWLLAEGRTDDVARIAGGILRDSPQDAVALYHLGAALIIDQDANKRNLALAYLRQGFDNGIERFMKIEPTLKAMILKAR